MPPSLRRLFSVFLALVLMPTLVADALAQDQQCEQEIEQAESLYRDSRFEDAEAILAACIDTATMSDDLAVRGYRLLGLTRLQLGDIAGARRAVLRVFARRPGYRANPVQDPPAYQALVETVRQQLAEAVPEMTEVSNQQEMIVEDAVMIPAYRASGRFYLRSMLGAGSYGGERGVEADSPVAEFTRNASAAFSVGAGYNISDRFSAYLSYDGAHYPTMRHQKATIFPVLDREASSSWVHLVEAGLIARVLPGRLSTPFVGVGTGPALTRTNDEVMSAVAVTGSLGVDVMLAPAIGMIAELSVRYKMPGDALDLIDRAGDYDLFTLVKGGLIWRVGSMR